MKLNFLKNTQQRLATGRRLPVKPLECVIMYGTPEQRMKAVNKTVPHAFGLCLNQHTSHVVITLAKYGGRTAVVELLFALRKKLLDLSRSHHGNVVIQEMLSVLPRVQQKEIAREFIEELVVLSTHESGNRVIQKMMTLPAARDELEEAMKEHFQKLAVHPLGQHVVAKWLENSELQVEEVLKTLDIPTLFENMDESVVLCFLVASSATTLEKREEIFNIAIDNAADLFEHKKHSFLFVHIFQHAPTNEVRAALFEALKPVLSSIVAEKGWCHVAAAIVRYCVPEIAIQVIEALGDEWATAMCDPAKTLTLRAWCESGMPGLTADAAAGGASSTAGRKSGKNSASAAGSSSAIAGRLETVLKNSKLVKELSENPVSSPVLQKIAEFGTPAMRIQLYKGIKENLMEAGNHNSAAYLVQALLSNIAADGVDPACATARTDMINKILAYPTQLLETVTVAKCKPAGRTGQAALKAGASNEQIKTMAERIIAGGAKELALDPNAAYLVSTTIMELNARGADMIEEKRALLNELKPNVFSLALSPWAGRIVLDAMFQSSSAQLTEAIKNVIYMKAEFWLSDAGVASEGKTRKTDRSDPDQAGMTQEAEAGRVIKKARKELTVSQRQQSLAANKAKTKTKLTHA